MCVTSSKVNTPIGLVTMKVSNLGIQQIALDSNYNKMVDYSKLEGKVKVMEIDGPDSKLHRIAIEWLEAFFDISKPQKSMPPIDNHIVSKENFTGLVLRTLMDQTTPGITLSYAELAKLCGSPKACRAVGQAMRSNPIPLVVPCHRVVASNGGLGHYMSGKGDNIKKWLLEMEKSKPKLLGH